MHLDHLDDLKHKHSFRTGTERQSERRTAAVVVLTMATMVVEIAAGSIFGSMALLADGWHMLTHASALGISLFAYIYARRHANNPIYTFGTGKVGVLGGFTSAVVLAVIALMMIFESVNRLFHPINIQFNAAIMVACFGLTVNLASAYILVGKHHGLGHDHKSHHDHNLRAAYLHVLTDALTSILAIIALFAGKFSGWVWMDPMMGIVGAVIISRWSWQLIRDSGRILLDGNVDPSISEKVRTLVEADTDNRVSDLHLWYVSPHHLAAIVSIATHYPKHPNHYKELFSDLEELQHVTVEVFPFPSDQSQMGENWMSESAAVENYKEN